MGVGVGPCFQSIKDDISTDLEGIKMEDLSLGCDFIREYLSPPAHPTNTQYESIKKIMDINSTQSLNSQQNVTVHNNFYWVGGRTNRLIFYNFNLLLRTVPLPLGFWQNIKFRIGFLLIDILPRIGSPVMVKCLPEGWTNISM